MSLPFITTTRIKRGGIIAVSISSLLIAVSALAPASGAYFTDAREGHATTSTGTFGLNVADGNEAFNFGFDGLLPGTSHTETFTVENTGSIPGSLAFYTQGMQVSGGANPDVSQLHYTIDDDIDVTPTGGQPNWMDLGELQGGQSRTYTITASLDGAAGNEWEGTTVTSTVGMTLRQAL